MEKYCISKKPNYIKYFNLKMVIANPSVVVLEAATIKCKSSKWQV